MESFAKSQADYSFNLIFLGTALCCAAVVMQILAEMPNNLLALKCCLSVRNNIHLSPLLRKLLSDSGINGSSRWSKSKDTLSKDKRYKAMPREHREKLFRDFIAQQKVRKDVTS